MVRNVHAAGIEVLLDVVYNHTCEGNERGPTLSWRGLANAAYYRLPTDERDRYVNYSGTGNTLDLRQPFVLKMIIDSLRYWVEEMHVDGFRFDLASILGRGSDSFDRDATFFAAINQDPVLSQVKLIAEPWDLGPDGYRVGGFLPAGPNGTVAIGMICAASGGVMRISWVPSLRASLAAQISINTATGHPARA